MAQPSSVQREPSMEEILASIRRIIEDNETSRKDEKVVPQPGLYRPSRDVRVDSPDEPQPQAVDQAPDETTNQTTQIRAPQEEPSTVEAVFAEPVAEPVLEEPVTAGLPEIDYTEAAIEQPEPVIHAQAAPSVSEPATAEQAVEQPENPILNIVEQHVADVIASSDEEEQATPIVSEQSVRKVAASFGELSDAYQATRRKTLADAADEMLRPMLREWLDDNLPQLVEKLVREEIERIARGS